jgi:ABC-type glutathione transport system ATPase component
MPDPLLEVQGLSIDLTSESKARTIVSDVSFEAHEGAIVGLFGESGCGKTTLGLALLNLLPADRYRVRGSIRLRGRELIGLGERAMTPIRGAVLSMIFQDPMLALNPVLRVGDQVAEVARAHAVAVNVPAVLKLAGLAPSPRILKAYPHQLSGGERQRVLIAQALACHPALIIADEPFTALDAPRVVELARLFRTLKETTDSGFVVISHSPGVLARIADSVLVMRDGRIVEQGPPRKVFGSPDDPYMVALLAAEGLPGHA